MASSGSSRRRKRKRVSLEDDDDDDAAVNAELRAFGFLVDDDVEDDMGRWGYDLKEKLTCERFSEENMGQMIERMDGKDYNARYFHDQGFKKPVLFDKSDGLGLLMPPVSQSSYFGVDDVKRLVGANRTIDVVDVKTQKGSQMTLRDFVDYFQKPDRTQLLNVLSLEFSKTKLAEYVRAPSAVSELDWVELAWPQELRAQQTEATNALNAMKYPKVQNYCLMSVGGCYTDFHIDFGGTSVWYHILQGEKIFWLIPPTEENCHHFQAWTLSGRQHKTFFADLVEHCVRVKLRAGNTFMIPSGWIHAVYTPVDSLVFGGNFLHSFAIPMQLSVYEIERNTHVPVKFRYPFFLEMHWYVLERYYSQLTGRSFLSRSLDSDNEQEEGVQLCNEKAVLLTDVEMEGLRTLVNWLQSLPNSKRCVPALIRQPDQLLWSLQSLLVELGSIRRRPSGDQYTILSAEPKVVPSQDFASRKNSTSKDVRREAQEVLKLEPSFRQYSAADYGVYSTSTLPSTSSLSSSSNLSVVNAMLPSMLDYKEPDLSASAIGVQPLKLDEGTRKVELNYRQQGESFFILPQESVPIVGAECTIETTAI